jgi:DNA-binding NarL/FixJ family response regulator
VFQAATMPHPSSVPNAPLPRTDRRSQREREVLAEVGTGASNADIAASLFMSEATAKAHVSHLLAKTRCSNRVQLALYECRTGLAI